MGAASVIVPCIFITLNIIFKELKYVQKKKLQILVIHFNQFGVYKILIKAFSHIVSNMVFILREQLS